MKISILTLNPLLVCYLKFDEHMARWGECKQKRTVGKSISREITCQPREYKMDESILVVIRCFSSYFRKNTSPRILLTYVIVDTFK